MPWNPILGRYEDVLTPSSGRVRVIRKEKRVIGYQDPDMVMRYTAPDGTITYGRNLFISREPAIERLSYDFKLNRVRDSFGQFVGVANLGLPKTGRITEYVTLRASWNRLEIDPRRFRPAPNEEIIERTIFVDRQGRLRLVRTSYGLGKKYDRSRYGGRWRSWASRALGLSDEVRATTAELQKAVLKKEFIVKRLTPRG